MASLLILLISSILFIPLVGAIGIFRLFFPKNTLKIKDAFLFPLGFCLVLTTNVFNIRSVLKAIPEEALKSYHHLIHWLLAFFRNCSTQDFLYNIYKALSFVVMPLIASLIISYWLHRCWERSILKQKLTTDSIWKAICTLSTMLGSHIVKTSVLNNMSQITAFDKDCEILMLDVFSNDEYIYSGVYSDYSLDNGKLHMISLKNILRYKNFYDDTSGNKVHTERYLLPNQGEIFFLAENIKNFHIWRIHSDDLFNIDLEKKYRDDKIDADGNSIVFAAWLMSVQWVSDIKFGIKILKPQNKQRTQDLLNKLNKLKIPRKEVQATFSKTQ